MTICSTFFDFVGLLKLPYPVFVGNSGELPRLARPEEQADELVLLADIAFFICKSDLPFMECITKVNLLRLRLEFIMILFIYQLRPPKLSSQNHLLRQGVRRRYVVVPLVLQILQLVHIFLDLFIQLLFNQSFYFAIFILCGTFVVRFLV